MRNSVTLKFLQVCGFVCLVLVIDAAPTMDKAENGMTVYDDSLLYRLFLRLMSNGSLRSWINQNFLKHPGTLGGMSFGISSQTGTSQGQGSSVTGSFGGSPSVNNTGVSPNTVSSTSGPNTATNLAIVRDQDLSVTGSFGGSTSVNNTGVNPNTVSSTSGPNTATNLTIVRDQDLSVTGSFGGRTNVNNTGVNPNTVSSSSGPNTATNLTIVRDQDSYVTVKTSSPDLIIERDHVSPTTTFAADTNIPTTGRNTDKKFTLPVIRLTEPGGQNIVGPNDTTENLTIIRDYKQNGLTTPSTSYQKQVARKKRAVFIPVLKLDSRSSYSNPSGNAPQQASLTDNSGQGLVIVRDVVSSNQAGTNTGSLALEIVRDRVAGANDTSGSQYVQVSDTTTSRQKQSVVVLDVCDYDRSRMCFKIKYLK